MTNTDPLVQDYLTRLEDAARSLPPGDRVELLHDITGHLSAAQDAASDELGLRTALDRLGEPKEVVLAYAGHGTDGLPPDAAGSACAAGSPAAPSRRRVQSAGITALAVTALVLLLTGATHGLRPRGFCGSPLRPAADPSGGGCAPLLDGPRTLAVVLLITGALILAAAAGSTVAARRALRA